MFIVYILNGGLVNIKGVKWQKMGRKKGYESHRRKFPKGFAPMVRMLFKKGWGYKKILKEFSEYNPEYHDLWKIINNKTYIQKDNKKGN